METSVHDVTSYKCVLGKSILIGNGNPANLKAAKALKKLPFTEV